MNVLRQIVFVGSVVAVMAAQSASADPAYKADDVVKFFTKEGALGATRGICVGTAAECQSDPGPAPSGFDMLVNFDLDSDVLTSEAKANLAEFAKALKDPRLSDARFAVEGHTDAIGAEPYNEELSVRRAKSVVSFLVEQGVPPERFETKGFGESAPRADDPFDPVNRRVETRILLR